MVIKFKKCLNYGFWTPEFLVTVSNIKVDIFSYNNKRINLCRRGGGGGLQRNRVFSRLSQISPRPIRIVDNDILDITQMKLYVSPK